MTPLYEKIQRWSEKKFQRNLYLLRDDLPECVRDLRETASPAELIDEVLVRIERGIRCVRSAAIIHGEVVNTRGVGAEQVEAWRSTIEGRTFVDDICDADDKLFPIRVPLVPSSDDESPLGFIVVGPRPDGSIPSKDEQRALKDLSEPIARAVRNVIKRQSREREVLDRIDALEAMLGDPALSPKRRPRTA